MANNIHPSHRSYFQSYLQSSYQAHPTTTFNIESYETTTNTNEGSLPNEMNADPESPSHSFSPSINSDAQQNSFEFQKNFTLYCSEKNRRTKKKNWKQVRPSKGSQLSVQINPNLIDFQSFQEVVTSACNEEYSDISSIISKAGKAGIPQLTGWYIYQSAGTT